MAKTTYQIRINNNFVYMAVQGTMDLEEVWRLDRAFWAVWHNHDRILMDYTGLERIDVSVKEFTQAGVTSQSSLAPQGKRIRAAYAAPDPAIYGFTRVIEEVWGSFVSVTTCRSLADALQWLDIEPGHLEAAEMVATG